MQGIDLDIWRRLKRRFFTPAGNTIALPVASTATTVTWVFARQEVDTAYGVACSVSWSTTAAVTTKTTASCTITFGTAAPSGATVDLSSFRSE